MGALRQKNEDKGSLTRLSFTASTQTRSPRHVFTKQKYRIDVLPLVPGSILLPSPDPPLYYAFYKVLRIGIILTIVLIKLLEYLLNSHVPGFSGIPRC